MRAKLPLESLRVVVTRARHQAGALIAGLEEVGARVESLPLLEVVPAEDPAPLDRAASELALYHWLVFTSGNAVEAFLPFAGGSVPTGLKVAVVGRATARALADWAIEPDLVSLRADAESLAEALAPYVGRRRRVLLPQAADARPQLADRLLEAGAEVVSVVAYDKRLPAEAPQRARRLFDDQPLGWVTFTSPRIVRHFVSLIEPGWEERRSELRAASIGPVTSRELRRQGVTPTAEAAEAGHQGLIEAIVHSVVKRPG
jgi:uroporphyrinogen-III synthase